MVAASLIALYLPALVFAYLANRSFQRFFSLYRLRFGSASLEQIYPQTLEDWEARYSSKPWRWLVDAPGLIVRTWKLTSTPQLDAELESVRTVGTRWAYAAIISAIGGMIAMVVAVSIR